MRQRTNELQNLHRIVSILLPYSGVTTGFFHGEWGAPFSKNYDVKVKFKNPIIPPEYERSMMYTPLHTA